MRLFINVIIIVSISQCVNVFAQDNVIRYPWRYGRISLNENNELCLKLFICVMISTAWVKLVQALTMREWRKVVSP